MTEEDKKDIRALDKFKSSNQDTFRESQIVAWSSADGRGLEITRYIIGLSSILIPIVISLFAVKELRILLNNTDRILMTISLFSFIIALSSGLLNLYLERQFFIEMMKGKQEELRVWSEAGLFIPRYFSSFQQASDLYDKTREKSQKIESNLKKDSNELPFRLQLFFVFIGVFCLLIVALKLLAFI